MTQELFNALVAGWMVLALVMFIVLFFVTAPYGRHERRGWGRTIASRWGWLLMEAPSALVFAIAFACGSAPRSLATWAFLLMWESHYVHRAFIYPFTLRSDHKRMPLAVMFMGIFFNLVNASLNGYYLFTLSGGYSNSWLFEPRFIGGALLFYSGYAINRWADRKLRSLRPAKLAPATLTPSPPEVAPAPGQRSYAIPQGGLYRYISSPNYLGEILEWCGWAIATWSLAGAAFAVWTVANLAPRARSNHRWYRKTFPDYPVERKALVPGVW